MKKVIIVAILATTGILVAAADDNDTSTVAIEQQHGTWLFHYQDKGQHTSFDQDMLQKSRLIKQIDHKTPEIYASLVQQLCKDRSSLQLLLLREALKRDAVDLHKKKKPSADTIAFANCDVRDRDLCWLTNTANFWDIKYTYKALIKRIAFLLQYGRIGRAIQDLNSDSTLDVFNKVNLFGLKGTIANKLQKEMVHDISMGPFAYGAQLNTSGSQIIAAYNTCSYGTSTINLYVYDIQGKKIIQNITMNTPHALINMMYHNNDTQIIVETANTLFVYNIADGALLNEIDIQIMRTLNATYHIHNSLLLVTNKDTVDLYDTQQKSCVKINIDDKISYVKFNPTGSEIAVNTTDKILFYATNNQSLIRSISVAQSPSLSYRICNYNADGSQLIVVHDNRALLFDTRNNQPAKEIINTGQQERVIKGCSFSPDNKIIFFNVDNELHIYNNDALQELVDKIELNPEWINSIRYIMCNHDGSRFVVADNKYNIFFGNKHRTAIYNRIKNTKLGTLQSAGLPILNPSNTELLAPQKDHIERYDLKTMRHVCLPTLQDHSYLANYNQTDSHLLITTPTRFILHPTLSDLDLHSLSFEQLNLLFKASNQWKKQEPYALKKADATCYTSLPPALQTDKLFTLAPRIASS